MLSPFFDFTDRFNWMDSFERDLGRLRAGRTNSPGGPPIYFRDAGSELLFFVDLPGVTEQDVEVTLEGDVLTLKAQLPKKQREAYRLVRAERAATGLHRQIELPVRVDGAGVVATLRDGVLEVRAPKAADAAPRKIPVVGAKPVASA
jgi:HSP20 family protein